MSSQPNPVDPTTTNLNPVPNVNLTPINAEISASAGIPKYTANPPPNPEIPTPIPAVNVNPAPNAENPEEDSEIPAPVIPDPAVAPEELEETAAPAAPEPEAPETPEELEENKEKPEVDEAPPTPSDSDSEEEPEPEEPPAAPEEPAPAAPAPSIQMGGALDSKLEQRIRAELPIFAEDSGVNGETIIKNVAKYIKNLKSAEYKQYLNALENLYSKVGKRAKIYNENNTVYLITSSASDISKKSNIIESVKKPKLVDINVKLDEARRSGDFETFETFRIYKLLVNHRNDLYNEEAQEDDEKIQEYELFLNKLEHRSLENDVIIVNTSRYTVPQILVDNINTANIKKLDDYNALMEQIRNKKLNIDKDLKTNIKEYLEQPKISVNEIKNKKQINFAILELPSAA